jgi:uncharacterized protein YkwD
MRGLSVILFTLVGLCVYPLSSSCQSKISWDSLYEHHFKYLSKDSLSKGYWVEDKKNGTKSWYNISLLVEAHKSDSYKMKIGSLESRMKQWTKEEIKKAKKPAYSNLLASKESKELIFYANLARLNGIKFVNTILIEYLKDTSVYELSLIKTLNSQASIEPLKNGLFLTKMAKSYARYAGKRGIVGHANFNKRFSFLMNMNKTVGENCTYGPTTGLGALMSLLIDESVPSLGHRKNILNKNFKKVGAAFHSHIKYDMNAVMEFSD